MLHSPHKPPTTASAPGSLRSKGTFWGRRESFVVCKEVQNLLMVTLWSDRHQLPRADFNYVWSVLFCESKHQMCFHTDAASPWAAPVLLGEFQPCSILISCTGVQISYQLLARVMRVPCWAAGCQGSVKIKLFSIGWALGKERELQSWLHPSLHLIHFSGK